MAAEKSVSALGNATSDAATFSSDTVAAYIKLHADNDDGTPADGDTVTFYALVSFDGTNYPADDDHGELLCTLDTNASDDDYKVVNCPVGDTIKIYAKNNSPNSHAITVDAFIWEIRRSNDPSILNVAWT